jgi:purine-nucleoside phosphorylase
MENVAEPARLEGAIGFLRERLTRGPRAVLVLGSGLSVVGDALQDAVRISYAEIPGFPVSTIEGHRGSMAVGIWNGVEVAVMQGRFHLYEGWDPADVVFPLRVLRALGADHLLVTNAAGGLRAHFEPGDLMLIADHINLMFRNPLIGSNRIGAQRFPDMSDPYDRPSGEAAVRAATQLGIPLHRGVYAGVLGPSFETPAELRFLQRVGADAVGMSTVPEVLAARALDMKVLGLSCITNGAFSGSSVSHEEVLTVAARASGQLIELLSVVLPRFVPLNLPTEAAS